MGYGGTVLAAITRIKENRAAQRSGKTFRADKKSLYFKHPDNGKGTFVAKELTEAEWADLRRRVKREVINRRITDAIILILALVGTFMVANSLML